LIDVDRNDVAITFTNGFEVKEKKNKYK